MALSVGYRNERAVYIALYTYFFVFSAMLLRADWVRVNAKKSVNRRHITQHWLQLGVSFLGIIKSLDPSCAFGIIPAWGAGLIDGIAASMCIFILQISAYSLALGHFAMLGQQPVWLARVFGALAISFTCVNIPLTTMAGYMGRSNLTFGIGLMDAVVIIVDLIVINVNFWKIRKGVILSDRVSTSATKAAPQLRRALLLVIAINVVLLALAIFLPLSFPPHSYFRAPIPASGAFVLHVSPGLLMVLLVTLWWTYHPFFPNVAKQSTSSKQKDTKDTSHSEKSTRPSSPGSDTTATSRESSTASAAPSPPGSTVLDVRADDGH